MWRQPWPNSASGKNGSAKVTGRVRPFPSCTCANPPPPWACCVNAMACCCSPRGHAQCAPTRRRCGGTWLRECRRLHGTSEPFSSCGFAGLQDVDGFGEVARAPGAAAELAQDVPGLELGVRALAGCSEPGVGLVRLFLRGGLVPPAVRGEQRRSGAVVALVGQDDQAGGGQLADDAPDPG